MKQHIKHLLDYKVLLPLALLYSITITVLFLAPVSGLPKISFSAADKIVHVSIYFILVNLWLAVFYYKDGFELTRKSILYVFFISLIYGILIELFQDIFTELREADLYDVVANVTGSLLGILFFSKIKNTFKI